MSESIPVGFPASTTDVQLSLCLLAKEKPDKLVTTVEKIYREYWAEGNSQVLIPDGFSAIFEEHLGTELANYILRKVIYSAPSYMMLHL
jgi:hypothetical protein